MKLAIHGIDNQIGRGDATFIHIRVTN